MVRPGDAVLVIHWRCDPATPRGPSLEIRPRPEQMVGWAKETGLLEAEGPVIDLPPWHYGIGFHRPRMAAEKTFHLTDQCQIVDVNQQREDLKDLVLGQQYRFTYQYVNGINVLDQIAPAQEAKPTDTASTK